MAGTLQQIPFGMHTAETRSGAVGLERLRNWYAQQSPQNAKGPVALYPTPGLKLWGSVSTNGCRGLNAMGGDLYAVVGNTVYAISGTAVATNVGTVAGAGHCYMTNNGTHVAICTSSKAYAANRDGVVELPEANLNGATYQDGYGIFTQAGTQNMWVGALDDMTSIPGTSFTSVDALTGLTKGCISDHREVWTFTEDSCSVFQNTGRSTFPFERVAHFERGCLAPASIGKESNTVFWVGDDRKAYMARGYEPQSISPPWIDRLLQGASDLGGARGFAYEQAGHTFWALCCSDLTLFYDVTTGMWHDRVSYGLDRWRAVEHAYFDGKNIVGDITNGNLYELDTATYTDNGDTIVRQVTAPPLWANGQRLSLHELQVDMETGTGLTTGQGSDPQVMLDWTDDYGDTWSNEVWAGLGQIGERHRRVTYNRLGSFRQRTLRITVSDPVEAILVGAHARIEARSS